MLETLPLGPQTGNALIDIIVAITDWLFAGFLVFAVIFIILAAFQFLSGEGDPTKMAAARKNIIFAVIAIIIASSAKGIVIVIRNIIGF